MMNERIRELQSKSYLMCKQIVDDDGHVVVTPDKWFDMFAELLITECLEECWYDSTPKQISDNIKTKFGVNDGN